MRPVNVVDYATLTVAGTAVGLADASPAYTAGHDVVGILATVETADVRVRMDGSAATTSEGHILHIGDVLNMTDDNYSSVLPNLSFIRDGSTSGVVKLTYFGR
jgi:hypothetical protein